MKLRIDFEIVYDNGQITSSDSEKEEQFNEVYSIALYFQKVIHLYYDCLTTDLFLKFGVHSEELYLLPESRFSISENITLSNLFKDSKDGFNEFICEEITRTPAKGCYFGGKDCTEPKYKLEKYLVVSYRARVKFPNVNEARIYLAVKNRFRENGKVSQKCVNLCIKCFHYCSTERTVTHSKKLENRMSKYSEQIPFESFTPAEMNLRQKESIGYSPDMHHPHKFALSVSKTPLREPEKQLRDPSPKAFYPAPNPLSFSKEKWVTRLSRPIYSPPQIVTRKTPRSRSVDKSFSSSCLQRKNQTSQMNKQYQFMISLSLLIHSLIKLTMIFIKGWLNLKKNTILK